MGINDFLQNTPNLRYPKQNEIKNIDIILKKKIQDIDLPQGTTIAAIVRGNDVLMAKKKMIIETNDHVILIVSDKKHVKKVESLFQVDITFL